MIPSNCRLRKVCVKEFCWTRSQRRAASPRAVWSQLSAEPKGGSHTKAKCPRRTTAPTLPAPNSGRAEKKIVLLLWLPCPVPSSASLLLISFLPPVSSTDSVSTCSLSRAASPQRHTAGREMKRDISPWKWAFPRKSRSESSCNLRGLHLKTAPLCNLSLKWELHLFHPPYKEAEVSV